MTSNIELLRTRMAELTDLRSASSLLEWDQQTMMPPQGAGNRAESLATLERIGHAMFTSADTGKLIDAAAGELDGASEESDDASLIRVVRRRWEKARRVPAALAADLARASSVGHNAWIAARENSDYAAFAPYLKRNLELARRYVDCFDGFDCAYDALLDDYEPGMKTEQVVAAVRRAERRIAAADRNARRARRSRARRLSARPFSDRRPAPAGVRHRSSSWGSTRTPGELTRPCTRSRWD